jgi:hypothetical protein
MSALREWQQFKDFGMTKDFPLVVRKADAAIRELEAALREKYDTTYRRDAVDITIERLTWMLERAECIATDLRQDHLEDRDWQELKNQLHTNLQVRWAERGQE